MLNSEVQGFDCYFCPICNSTHVKNLEVNNIFIKFSCKNKDCEYYKIPFIVLNNKINYEEDFLYICNECEKPLNRDYINADSSINLKFYCTEERCKNNYMPIIYDLKYEKWQKSSLKLKKKEDSSIIDDDFVLDLSCAEDIAYYLLRRENRALSAIEMHKICYRENLGNEENELSWELLHKKITKEIKTKNSRFVEIRQDIFELKERVNYEKREVNLIY